MIVKLSEIENKFKEITTYEIENEDTRGVIDEIFDNYSNADFNLIGNYNNLSEAEKYVTFKVNELLHNNLPVIAEIFKYGDVLLNKTDGSKRTVTYNGKENMNSSSFFQSENSPIDNNIENIQTPILKNGGKGENVRTFEDRNDTHEYVSVDEFIRKYNFLTRSDFATLHSFCERKIIMPLIDEFNTIY